MALTRLDHGESDTVRRGDAVFSLVEDEKHPLHVGVFVGPVDCHVSAGSQILVNGLPHSPSSNCGDPGPRMWNTNANYGAHIVGHNRKASRVQLNHVVLLSEQLNIENRLTPYSVRWKAKKRISDTRKVLGFPMFERGNCAHYVNYLYATSAPTF